MLQWILQYFNLVFNNDLNLNSQADISTIARKTGITSATQLAKLVPKDADKGRVPDVEWWDAHIMADTEYPAGEGSAADIQLREGAVTKLIEHPIQMMPLEPMTQGLHSIRFYAKIGAWKI